jgi:hypothetical protein
LIVVVVGCLLEVDSFFSVFNTSTWHNQERKVRTQKFNEKKTQIVTLLRLLNLIWCLFFGSPECNKKVLFLVLHKYQAKTLLIQQKS